MKVLQINSVCGVGSTGRIVVGIHDSLVSRGHDSYIAFGRLSPRNYNNVIRIESQIGIYSHVVLTRLFDNHGFGSKRATQLFVERIKSLDLDIVHIHNIHGYYINVEVLFKYLKRQQKPVVWTLHDCWAFTGHCTILIMSSAIGGEMNVTTVLNGETILLVCYLIIQNVTIKERKPFLTV